MDVMNIEHHKRGNKWGQSNYRLRGEKLVLSGTRISSYVRPDGDGWEPIGPEDITEVEKFREKMRVRGGRKQVAARRARKFESAKVVKIERPAPHEVVDVRLAAYDEGKSPDPKAVEVAFVQAQIRELSAQLATKLEEKRLRGPASKESKDALRARFEERRKK